MPWGCQLVLLWRTGAHRLRPMQINLEEQQGWGCLYPMMGSELPSELGKPRAEEPELPVSPPPANLQFP